MSSPFHWLKRHDRSYHRTARAVALRIEDHVRATAMF